MLIPKKNIHGEYTMVPWIVWDDSKRTVKRGADPTAKNRVLSNASRFMIWWKSTIFHFLGVK